MVFIFICVFLCTVFTQIYYLSLAYNYLHCTFAFSMGMIPRAQPGFLKFYLGLTCALLWPGIHQTLWLSYIEIV